MVSHEWRVEVLSVELFFPKNKQIVPDEAAILLNTFEYKVFSGDFMAISIKLENEVVNLVDHLAKVEYKKRSEVIKEAIVMYLKSKLGNDEFLDFVSGMEAMEESVKTGVREGRSR